jgi:hypothetical protein
VNCGVLHILLPGSSTREMENSDSEAVDIVSRLCWYQGSYCNYCTVVHYEASKLERWKEKWKEKICIYGVVLLVHAEDSVCVES